MTDPGFLDIVDSHTGGEPTRVITGGFAALRGSTVAEQRDDLRASFGTSIGAIVDEPRGTEATVAALLVEPSDPSCTAGVIFFDRSAVLGMCGHGTIGVVETLRFLGRLDAGAHRIETPAGVVDVVAEANGEVTVQNVPSRRIGHRVTVEVDAVGPVSGDVAYGGNVFFMVDSPVFDLDRDIGELLAVSTQIRDAVHAAGWSGVDHVELYGVPTTLGADSRSFVLCPSGTYDRSPCGTGTSAKLACLAAEQTLAPGAMWVQESITGSTFRTSYRLLDPTEAPTLEATDLVGPVGAAVAVGPWVAPTITGSAEIVAVGRAVFADWPPFCARGEH